MIVITTDLLAEAGFDREKHREGYGMPSDLHEK